MSRPINRPRLNEEALNRLLRGMIDSRIAGLPEPIRVMATDLYRATSSEALDRKLYDLGTLGIDWSRAGPTMEGWSADYCRCMFCGQQTANKRGIEDHLHNAGCDVFQAIKLTARIGFCDTSHWRREVAAEHEAEEERNRNLCVVDLDRGQERVRSGYSQREDLQNAEARMKALGFKKTVRKLGHGVTEIRWEMTTDQAYVLADPRQEGRIYLRAWPLNKKAGYKGSDRSHIEPEYILDNWHRDLLKKVEARIAKQLAAR
jgi:hypothetical protein